jgi:hypothetical protein
LIDNTSASCSGSGSVAAGRFPSTPIRLRHSPFRKVRSFRRISELRPLVGMAGRSFSDGIATRRTQSDLGSGVEVAFYVHVGSLVQSPELPAGYAWASDSGPMYASRWAKKVDA